MVYRHINQKPMAPVLMKSSTCLIVMNCQLGFRDVESWGRQSNPDFEKNVARLLEAFRHTAQQKPEEERPQVIHVHHRPVWTDHPLHKSKIGPWGEHGEEKRAVDFLEFAIPMKRDPVDGIVKPWPKFDEPDDPEEILTGSQSQDEQQVQLAESEAVRDPVPSEAIMFTHGHNMFVHSNFLEYSNENKLRTFIFVGMPLEHGISAAIHSAHHHALVGDLGLGGNKYDSDTRTLWSDGVSILGKLGSDDEELSVDMGRILLVRDAVRAFCGDSNLDPGVIQDVHVHGLGNFCEVRTTQELIDNMQ